MARKNKGEIENCIQQLEELVLSRRFLEMKESEIALYVGMTEKTVRKHLNDIKAKVGSRTIDMITKTFLDDFEEIMGEIKKGFQLAKEEENMKLIAYYTDRLSKAWITFADLLQKFGILQPVTQKVELDANITQRSLHIEVVTNANAITKD